jgi:hypothetical protein
VTGKIPKLWNAENGKISALGYEIKNGRTVVPLNFKSWDAIFVIFQEQATQEKHSLSKPVKESEQILSGKWTLALGDKSKELNELQSWTDSEDTKHFSGTAFYTYTFTQKKKVKAGETYLLQFKDIKNIAEVALNNETLGTIWKKPYEIDITSALKKGTNELIVKVTNTWVNRLIGDAQADEKDKTTFTTMSFYNADATLLPSGLIGEVKVVQLK